MGACPLDFKHAMTTALPALRTPTAEELAQIQQGQEGRDRGLQSASLTHLPRTSLLPATPLVTTWHQHTKTSIPSTRPQDEKRQHSAPSSLRTEGVLITPVTFPLTKIMPGLHEEIRCVCSPIRLSLTHTHLPRGQTPLWDTRWRGASTAGISHALDYSQPERGSTWLQPLLQL